MYIDASCFVCDWLLYFKTKKRTRKIAAISRWSTFDKEARRFMSSMVFSPPSLDFSVSFASVYPADLSLRLHTYPDEYCGRAYRERYILRQVCSL